MRILVLCTGNSARSQIAEGLLKSFEPALEVYSAGTEPAARVHPAAIRAMQEIGIDIGGARPKSVDRFLADAFDFVLTVCDHARETCPVFSGTVRRRVHVGFDDPARAAGPEDEVLREFRRVRDQIKTKLYEFYENELRGKRQPG